MESFSQTAFISECECRLVVHSSWISAVRLPQSYCDSDVTWMSCTRRRRFGSPRIGISPPRTFCAPAVSTVSAIRIKPLDRHITFRSVVTYLRSTFDGVENFGKVTYRT